MKKMMNKVQGKMIEGMMWLKNCERGDTNFISILIVMGIVILLAGLFIGFKDKIVGMVQEIVDSFVIS